MPIIAGAIMGTAALGGGVLGANAQQKAARQQADLAREQYAQQRALQQPYMDIGNAAMNPLLSLYGINANLPTGSVTGPSGNAMNQFYSSPEYTIQKQALDQALERQAAQQGTRYSPSTALGKAEISGRAFGDWRNNLANLAAMGPQGAGIQSTNLSNLYSGLGQSVQNMGNARAGMYGAVGQTVADLGGQFGQYQAYNRQMQSNRDMLAQLYGGAGPMQPTAAPMYGGGLTMAGGAPTIQSYNF